jgi:putative membrane protein insertion efficiency factor
MIRWLFILPIRAYRLTISPWLPPACRFYPTCSEYAQTAIRRHGAVKGLLYSLRRFCRCHPWSAGGYDPVG